MIKLKDVQKFYDYQGKRLVALKDINITIPRGKIFGIIGKSGAGKSTLLRCMNLLEKPSHGEVLLDNMVLNQLSGKALRDTRRKMGMIFQNFNLLGSCNVFDNVALPLKIQGVAKKEIRQKVNKYLDLVELGDKSQALPAQLSGGQKQRVAIARALVTDPEVLLCDEATSALDPETTTAILSLLKKINQNLSITIVLITHEMEVIKQICHEVAVLDKGSVIEQSSVVQLFTQPQTELAKRLTGAALHIELPDSIASTMQKSPAEGLYPIVRLSFLGDESRKPLMSELMKYYQVAANILLADIETVSGVTIGVTVCQFVGDAAAIELALQYAQKHVLVEVLGYAS